MRGVVLPGQRAVRLREIPDPEPGYGQVVIAVRASGLCGSDLRVIYRRHPGAATPYRDGRIAGHEPAGDVIAVGAGVRSVSVGDRVAVYHIAGCGYCVECRVGRQVSCVSSTRSAYGYHRDGGHAPYLLAEERSLVRLPDQLSYADGALGACGLGTAFQALSRAEVTARDRVLVVGLGPLGLGVAMLAGALGAEVTGVDPNDRRAELAGSAVDCEVYRSEEGMSGEFDVAVDCSGSSQGRLLCLHRARRRARVIFLGEGGEVTLEPSPMLIHRELTLLGSWVCDIGTLGELFDFLDRRGLRTESVITHRFPLSEAARAYQLFDEGRTGKVILECEPGDLDSGRRDRARSEGVGV